MKKVLYSFLMALAVLFVACDEQPENNGNGNGNGNGTIDENVEYTLTLSVVGNITTLSEGETAQLVAELAPAADVKIVFASSNTGVVTVNENGLVTAVAAGNADVTATVEGHDNLKSTVNFTVLAADDVLSKVNFYNATIYGFYTGRQYPLSYMRGEIDENGDTTYVESNDINNDGEPDVCREAAMYILGDGVYMDQYGLTGEENYVIFIHTACPFDGTYVYPFGFYQFSANESEYLVEHEGSQYMRWTMEQAYATYTTFNATAWAKYICNYVSSNGEWPATQADYDAFVEEYGEYLSGSGSHLCYLRVPEGSDAYVQEPVGLLTGGNGFAYDWDENEQPYMPYLDAEVEFFTNIDSWGMQIEQLKDEEGNLVWYDEATGEATLENTGEPWMVYSEEGEGEDKTFVMAPTVKRHFKVGKLASEAAPRKAPAAQMKGISMKRIQANTLLNVAMKNILLKK